MSRQVEDLQPNRDACWVSHLRQWPGASWGTDARFHAWTRNCLCVHAYAYRWCGRSSVLLSHSLLELLVSMLGGSNFPACLTKELTKEDVEAISASAPRECAYPMSLDFT